MLSFAAMPSEGCESLADEAIVLGRHLMGTAPPAELVGRYVDAVQTLLPDAGSASGTAGDAAMVAFALRHPWSVGCLDAAAALLRPGALLRRKLLLLTAVLEASPRFADDFLPRSASLPVLLWRSAGLGLVVVGKVVAGLLLWPLAARGRP